MPSQDLALLKLLQSLCYADILQIPGIKEHLLSTYKTELKKIESRLSWCKAEAWQERPIAIKAAPTIVLGTCTRCGIKRKKNISEECCSACREKLGQLPYQLRQKATA